MRILITGNLGYVGSTLVPFLKRYDDSFSLVGWDAGFFAHSLTNCKVLPEQSLGMQFFGDTRDLTIENLKGFEAIVHLAAVSNDPMGQSFEAVTHEINRVASVKIAKMAAEAGVKKFVFASSCSMYGAASENPKTEKDATNPLTAYAKSKIGTEQDLTDVDLGDMVVTNLRFATACGMSDRLRLDLVLNDFVASAVSSGKIEILSDGSPWRPLIDVEDMSRAILWACMRSASDGGQVLSVNAGRSEWNYQVKDLAEAVVSQIPGCELSLNKDAQPDKRSYKVDFSLFESLAPEFSPRISLDESISRLISGLREMNFSSANFRDTEFMRLKILNRLKANDKINNNLRWIG